MDTVSSNPRAVIGLPDAFSLVLEDLKDHAIFLIDSTGLISSWNVGAERVFGFKDTEALGKSFSTIFTPEDVLAGIPEKELATARLEGKAEDERWHQRKDGSRFWASGAVIPLPAETGTSHFVKVVRDATDRKRSEDADRMESIGRLAGGVAHDYNNMLTSIIGYCELLAESTAKDSPHQAWISEALTAANRAATLTRNLLVFSRRQMIAPERINLNDIIRNLQGRLRRTLGDRVQLVTNPDPGLEDSLLDRGQIEQMLLNLAVNAREAMPDGGVVTVSTLSAEATWKAVGKASAAGAATAASAATALNAANVANVNEILPGPSGEKIEGEPKDYVTLIFKDNGKGMDAETSAHAFDPFFSTKPKSTGSVGLGLSTGYGIIQQSGGTISLSSVPDSGTEFEIHLPVFTKDASLRQQRGAPVAKSPAVQRETEVGWKATILLVEDETAVRKLILEVLRKSGFRILEAKDGEEGSAIFNAQGHLIDVVVTDVVMPKMSGLVMARQILSRQPDIPIVFMYGYSEDPLFTLTMPDGKYVFLHKPFSVANLLGKIDEAINSRPIEKAHADTSTS